MLLFGERQEIENVEPRANLYLKPSTIDKTTWDNEIPLEGEEVLKKVMLAKLEPLTQR